MKFRKLCEISDQGVTRYFVSTVLVRRTRTLRVQVPVLVQVGQTKFFESADVVVFSSFANDEIIIAVSYSEMHPESVLNKNVMPVVSLSVSCFYLINTDGRLILRLSHQRKFRLVCPYLEASLTSL